MKSEKKIKVAVLYGGPSSERSISILTAKQVIAELSRARYEVYPIEVSKKGVWVLHMNNARKELTLLSSKNSDLKKFDVFYIALHGSYGEDGSVQALLDMLNIPYTGSGVMASAIGMNKIKTLNIAMSAGLTVPKVIEFNSKKHTISTIQKQIGFPCVIKPNASGSSVGITIIKKKKAFKKALSEALREDDRVIVEEYISGTELTCGVLGNFGSTALTALPPVEIQTQADFFDYEAKYFSAETVEICPPTLGNKIIKQLQNQAITIHEALECRGLTRSDFILRNNELYFLEINTLPGMTKKSLCPKEALAAGITFSELLDKQIMLALQ